MLIVVAAFLAIVGCASSPSADIAPQARALVRTTEPYAGSLEYVGNIWPSNTFSDANFLFYWNQVTPEEASFWSEAEPDQDDWEWDDLDDAVRIGQVAGAYVRIHGLLRAESEPDWLADLDEEEQREEIDEWFTLLAERYPVLDFVDVVSDPFGPKPEISLALGGTGSTGYDWIISAYELARQRFPASALGLSQSGVIFGGGLDDYLELLNVLQSRGLVDAISVTADSMEAGELAAVSRSLDRLGATGLPVYVTEFAVDIVDDRDHADRTAELVSLFANHPAVRGITFWGYREGRLERRNAYLMRADGSHRPTFDWLVEYFGLPLPAQERETD